MPRCKIIQLYIIKNFIGPFLVSFLLLTFLFLMDRVFELFDYLIGKGIPWQGVAELFLLSLPFIIAITIPISVLTAIVMAFGKMSERGEIIGIKASGLHPGFILLPTIVISLMLSTGLVWFNNHILPPSNHRLRSLLVEIARKKPMLKIEPRRFITQFEGYTLWIEEIDHKTGKLKGITIYENSKPPRLIVATSGELAVSPDGHFYLLSLEDGEVHEKEPAGKKTYRRSKFQHHRIKIPYKDEWNPKERKYRGDREMSTQELMTKIREMEQRIKDKEKILADTTISQKRKTYIEQRIRGLKRRQSRYWVEIHKKFSIPTATTIFILLGAPLGVYLKRGGLGIGFGTSLVVSSIYYSFIVIGESLADRGILSPLVAMWLPNVIFLIVGIYLVYCFITDRKPL